jgi:four helix bundle protein
MHQRPHEKLVAWQEAYQLCIWIYQLTQKFPPAELFGLVSQMRRSAYSVPMEIAEGNMRRSKKDRAHFLERAIASLEELHCQCRLSLDLAYITKAEFERTEQHIHRVSYLLTRLRSSLV